MFGVDGLWTSLMLLVILCTGICIVFYICVVEFLFGILCGCNLQEISFYLFTIV